ncbi:hypothetical protein QAD02_023672 [Eretmocerus hayati]|uniref:Uncharacterized protein n=1 Tax=Eretmocerus hayati TaxID=131215 RepID=A0ACC2PWN4_9HYME|nr:hypothetical protein QAD02_023672 [Eretmocerus hayati]
MKTFLLTLAIFAVSTIDAIKVRRDILPGDSRYGTPYHLEHHHAHNKDSAQIHDLKNYLPPSNGKELQLPSTGYGVPFNQAQAVADAQANAVAHAVQQPATEYQQPALEAPIHHEVQHVHQPVYVETPAKVSYTPNQSYGVPVKTAPQPTYQPVPVYQPQQKQVPMILPAPTPLPVQPVYTPVQQPNIVKVQPQPQPTYTPTYPGTHSASVNSAQSDGYAYQKPQIIPAPAPIKQVYQPAQPIYTPVQPSYQQQYVQKAPVTSYPAPVAPVKYYPAPSVVPVKNSYPNTQYGVPSKVYQPDYPQIQPAYVPAAEAPYQYYKEALPVQDNLIFELPIKAVELAQVHSVEHLPAPVHNQAQATQDAVGLEAPISKGPSNEYLQPTGSNGGYVY